MMIRGLLEVGQIENSWFRNIAKLLVGGPVLTMTTVSTCQTHAPWFLVAIKISVKVNFSP